MIGLSMAGKARRHLVLKGQTWWFKQDIPAAIRPHFDGKTAYLESLKTGDIRTAMLRRDAVAAEVARLFNAAKAGVPPDAGRDAIRLRAEAWLEELAAYRVDPVAWNAKVTGQDPSAIDPEYMLSPEGLIEDEAERIERGTGEPARRRFLSIVAGKVPVDHYLEAYLKEPGFSPKTIAEKRGLVRTFGKWCEKQGINLSDVNRRIIGQYVTQCIVVRHKATAKKHVSCLKRYWEYVLKRGNATGENPWKGQLEDQTGRAAGDEEDDERAFTDDEVRALLYSPFPTEMSSKFKTQLHDLMRIGALSGMRLGEIAQLMASDCVLAGDHSPYFNIRKGKTKAARRRVPIHPDLVPLVESRLTGKPSDDWLFHELKDQRDAGDVIGKRFAAYRVRVGVDDVREGKRRSLVNFHSFRRWFATQAERADQPASTIAAVMGHKVGRESLALGVYSAGPAVAQAQACVAAIRLPSPKLDTEAA